MSLLDGQDQSPIQPFPQQFPNLKTTVFNLPIEHTVNMKALVLTDQFFGKTLPLTKSIPQCMKNIMTIIVREGINCIFFIGDLVHFQKDENETKSILTKVLKVFEEIPLPIYVMGGEQNRQILYNMKYQKPGSNVHVVYDFMIKIKHPNPPIGTIPNIYLTHDAKNPLTVKPDQVESFVFSLKNAFSQEIANEDFLLVGHCNGYSFNEQGKYGSIKEFSPDNHRNGYAIITCTKEGFNVNIVGK